MRHCINRIKHVVQQIVSKMHYENMLNLLICRNWKYFLFALISAIVVGTITNYSTSNPLPLFWLYIIGFSEVLSVTLYSVRMLHKNMKKFDISASGDASLLNEKAKYKQQYNADYNWILTFLIPTIVVLIIQHLITIQMSLLLKIFCYGSLFFIIGLSVVTYAQYVHFILFVRTLSKIRSNINVYDHITPYKSPWIIALSETANKESNLFFVVGLTYIILFYVISFSGLYGIANVEVIDSILLGGLWLGAIIGIVVLFPIYTVVSYLKIKKIINKINDQQEQLLRRNCSIAQAQPMFTYTHQLILFNFLSLPTYPCKPLISYAISYVIAAINFVASLQACYSILEIVQPKA